MPELIWKSILSQLASCLALLKLRPEVPPLFAKLARHKPAFLLLLHDPSPLLDHLLNFHSLQNLLSLLFAGLTNRNILFI
jgi:hypothetical protein